jgi:hypothetical protein
VYFALPALVYLGLQKILTLWTKFALPQLYILGNQAVARIEELPLRKSMKHHAWPSHSLGTFLFKP